MSEVTAILERAWKRIEDPKNWTQEALAQDRDGHIVSSSDPSACRFCALGALSPGTFYEKVMVFQMAFDILTAVAERMANETISGVNDRLGHDAVRQMYALAIEKSKAEAA